MKIFYLITKSETGGAQTHIYQLSNYFVKKGCKVAIMSFPGGWLEKEAEKLGVEFYANEFLSNNFNPLSDFKAIKLIKEAIKDFQPELVSCHSSKAGFLGRLAVRNKIPVIFTAHGWPFTGGAPLLRKYATVFFEKIAALFCKKIICVSEFDKELALKYKIADSDKLVTVHNGVELNIESNIKEINFQREIVFPIKIVFVGRLSEQKNPFLLLEAFKDISPDLRNKAKVFIIGDGPKKAELKNFIQSNHLADDVKLIGELPRQELLDFLKKCHIFVLISNWEGFPISILEAMRAGLAIIASDIGGVAEIIDENCGILIKRNKKESIRLALERLIKKPELIQKIGQRAFQKAITDFSLEKTLKSTEKIYTELTNSSN